MPDQAVFHSPRALIEQAGTITIPELYEWHAEHNADYPLFRFHDTGEVKDVTYAQACKGILRAARYVQSLAGSASAGRKPIAIFANAGACLWFYAPSSRY